MTNPCDICNAPIDGTGWKPEGHGGPVTCRACYEDAGGPERARRRGYVSPDDYTRNREHYDHAATEARQRIVDNRPVGRRLPKL